MNIRELSKTEIKRILKKLSEEYKFNFSSFNFLLEEFKWFLTKKENRIYIINKNACKYLNKKINITRFGLYICKIEKDGIRLSIEGSQIFGPYSKEKVIEYDMKKFMSGSIPETELKGYIIVKERNYFSGTFKIAKKRKINYVGKNRRILI